MPVTQRDVELSRWKGGLIPSGQKEDRTTLGAGGCLHCATIPSWLAGWFRNLWLGEGGVKHTQLVAALNCSLRLLEARFSAN